MHARTHARTHAPTHIHTHTHTNTSPPTHIPAQRKVAALEVEQVVKRLAAAGEHGKVRRDHLRQGLPAPETLNA